MGWVVYIFPNSSWQIACSMIDKDALMKKLIYQSSHRGCKEMDFIFGKFASNKLENLSNEELLIYEELLLCDDAIIYDWILKKEECPEKFADLFKRHLHSCVL